MVDVSRNAARSFEDYIEAFESAPAAQGAASLVDFLPPADHPDYAAVATELVRIDMERSWAGGANYTVDRYQELLPRLFADPATLASVAFEEYRLRTLAGQHVNKADYGRRFAIATDDWPQFGPEHAERIGQGAAEHGSESDARLSGGIGLNRAWDESLRLADDVDAFPEIGATLDEFTLERELGRGAFARVYLARQTKLADRPVVLKVASGRTLEPQHLARLQHTNIVPIYSAHRLGNFTVACMPFLGSCTLADVIRGIEGGQSLPTSGAALIGTIRSTQDETVVPRIAKIAESETIDAETVLTPRPAKRFAEIQQRSFDDAVVDLIRQAAEGLAHAHVRGIVHRDLKPANILLADDARPLLLDFNLSDDVVVSGRPSLMVGGTLPYMSPEQLRAVRSGGRVDERSDIYSLGIILYELLAARRPFPDRRGGFEAVIDAMLADRVKPAPDVRRHRRAVPPAVASIVMRCLAPTIAARYQTANELVEDLSLQLANRPLRYAPNPSLLERVRKWSRRHPRTSSVGVVGAVASCIFLAIGLVGARWYAERQYHEFQSSLPAGLAQLNVAETDPELIATGIAQAETMLAPYGVDSSNSWRNTWQVRSLNGADRARLATGVGELAFLLAESHARLAAARNNADAKQVSLSWNQIAAGALPAAASQAIEVQRGVIEQADAGPRDIRERIAAASSAAHSNDTDPLQLRLTAMNLLGAGEYRQALPLLERVRDANPQDASTWLMLGNAYAAAGEALRAEVCYEAASALLPGDAHYIALYNRGILRFQEQRFSEALADFDEIIRRNPKLACAYLNRGLILQALNRHEEAIADFTTGLELGTNQTRVYFLRSRSELALGKTAGARSDFEQGIALEPQDALSWIARGIAQLGKDPSAALEDFRAALRLSPRNRIALQNIVHVAADRLNRQDDARRALDEMLEIRPDDSWALAGRAVLNARQGERTATLDDLAALLHLSRQPVHYFQAACALSLLEDGLKEDRRQALAYLTRAVIAEPALALRAKTDPDLSRLRQLPEFASVLAAAIGTEDATK